MLGLVLKDFYYLKKQCFIYFALIAFYIFLGISDGNSKVFSFFVVFISFFLPITIYGFDEKTNWDKFALAMPLSRKDLVISKYIFVILFCLFFSILDFIFRLFIYRNQTVVDSFILSLFVLSIAILFISLIIPLIIKFGIERGRIVLMIVVLIPVILLMLFDNLSILIPTKESLNTLYHVVPFISVILLLCSIGISTAIYNKKEF